MEQNYSVLSPENIEQNEIKQAVDYYLDPIICYCAININHFPMECCVACKLLQQEINASYNFNLIFCEGSRTDTNSNHKVPHHTWLECGDLIIDPMDFLSEVILYDLLKIDYYKEYLENPDEKERNFQELVDSLKNGQISKEEFINELRISYECKTFYSKSDHESGIIYEQNAKHAE